jgi:hypothetical protein
LVISVLVISALVLVLVVPVPVLCIDGEIEWGVAEVISLPRGRCGSKPGRKGGHRKKVYAGRCLHVRFLGKTPTTPTTPKIGHREATARPPRRHCDATATPM